MSRSYKHTPVIKDHNSSGKHQANRTIRRTKDLQGKGTLYKKFYPQWDVSEWRSYISLRVWLACGKRRVNEYMVRGMYQYAERLRLYYTRENWLKRIRGK